MSPFKSSSEVVLIPISVTFPRKELTWMMSPIINCFSKMINKPAMTSSMSDWAPKLIANPTIPAPASSVGVSTPQVERTRKIARIDVKYLNILFTITQIVERLLRFLTSGMTKYSNNLFSNQKKTIMTRLSTIVIVWLTTSPTMLKNFPIVLLTKLPKAVVDNHKSETTAMMMKMPINEKTTIFMTEPVVFFSSPYLNPFYFIPTHSVYRE